MCACRAMDQDCGLDGLGAWVVEVGACWGLMGGEKDRQCQMPKLRKLRRCTPHSDMSAFQQVTFMNP